MNTVREEKTELTFAEAVAEAAALVNSSLDVETVLDRILEQVTRVVPGDTCNIMLVEDDLGRVVRWRGYRTLGVPESDIRDTLTRLPDYTSFQKMRQTREPIVIADTMTCTDWVSRSDRVEHRAYVGAPICIHGQVEGFINVNSSRPNQFHASDARRLQAFANHAAVALQNARLYAKVSRHAHELEVRVRQRTHELQRRTAWAEAILRSTSDGILVTDPQGTIIQINPVAKRWLRYDLSPHDAAALRDAVNSIVGSPESDPERLLALTGIDLQLSAAPVVTSDAQISAFVVAVHDVSHLRALDRMKSQFISDASHELRTPITAIKLYASLIENSTPDKRGEYFHSLDIEIERVSRLVEAMLQIARIEAGRTELQRQHIDLNLLASSAVSSYTATANAKGLAFGADIDPQPIPVFVDPHWLILAINNLVENALNYTPDGEIQLATGTLQNENRSWAWLRVEDSGIGIRQEEQIHLFERFFRGEEPRTMQLPGSGLGLAITKGILELHGGQIVYEDHPAGGARFTLSVPLDTDPR